MGTAKNAAQDKQDKARAKATKRSFEWVGWIEINLTDVQKAEVGDYIEQGEFTFDYLDVLVSEGYKVTFAESPDGRGFRCSVIDMSLDSTMCGYGLSGWGDSVTNAWSSFVYKHKYVLQEEWFMPQGRQPVSKFS